MEELVYKKIERKDEKQVRELIKIVLEKLERPEFFIAYEDEELDNLFDEGYAPLYGAYDGDKLVGMAQLYVDQEMLKEFKDVIELSKYRVCELGGCLVLPGYRGRGIMFKLIEILYKFAEDLKFDYIISMAHPDNIASNKSLKKVGLDYIKTSAVANGYLRDIYSKKL